MDWIINNYIEILASILGIIGVWLATKQNIWCWPIGLLNVALSMHVFFSVKLYYDFILQFFYFFITIYGWYIWKYGKGENDKLVVSNIKIKPLIINVLIIIIGVIVFGSLAENYTDASLPYWDSFTTIGGIIATLWTAKKIIENWILWIVIDTLCIFIYLYKELYAFSFLYFIFTLLAIIGYIRWKQDLKKI